MAEKDVVLSLTQEEEFSLDEITQAFQISADLICQLLAYGIIEPQGLNISAIRLNFIQVLRIQRIMRLQKDLEVNLAGAVLALELIETIENLHTRVKLLEKHLLST